MWLFLAALVVQEQYNKVLFFLFLPRKISLRIVVPKDEESRTQKKP